MALGLGLGLIGFGSGSSSGGGGGGGGTGSTFNPEDLAPNSGLSSGNLVLSRVATGTGVYASARSITGKSSGKYYFEAEVTNLTGGSTGIGIANLVENIEQYCGKSTNSIGLFPDAGSNTTVWFNDAPATGSPIGAGFTSGQRIAISVDLDGDSIGFSDDGSTYHDISIASLGAGPYYIMGSIFVFDPGYNVHIFTSPADWSFSARSGGYGEWTEASDQTFDPVKKHASMSLSGGNRVVTNTLMSNWRVALGQNGKSTGKWCIAYQVAAYDGSNQNFFMFGMGVDDASYDVFPGNYTGSFCLQGQGNPWFSGFTAGVSQTFAVTAAGEWIAFYIDFDAGKVFTQNSAHSFENGQDPVTGANPWATFTPGDTYFPAVGVYSNADNRILMLSGEMFPTTVPSGFTRW